MEWMHEKYLRNLEREEVETEYEENMIYVACGMPCGPPRYPARAAGNSRFESVGDFQVHPNTSEAM